MALQSLLAEHSPMVPPVFSRSSEEHVTDQLSTTLEQVESDQITTPVIEEEKYFVNLGL